jgi:GDP-L-fucose synthase
MEKDARIFVAGHRGLVGSGLVRALMARGHSNLLLKMRQELDLRDGDAVRAFFRAEEPEYVLLAAARVGGILANDTLPAEFIHDNLAIQTNVIENAHRIGVRKLLFLGSSCIYPREAPQPIREEALLSGPLETTNRAYAVAKIAGVAMCQAYARQYGCRFISVMPTNLYGPGDNYDPESSHVVPALIRKFVEAERNQSTRVVVWGSGTPRREFLYIDDLADACLFLMDRYDSPEIINIGTGTDVTIAELASLIRRIVEFQGDIVFDRSKPDGTPRKLLDVSRLTTLGWRASVTLEEGLQRTIGAYLNPPS